MNTRGEFTIPCKYSFIANGFDDKYVLIGINNKYGFADKATGQIVIPPIYEIDYSGWSFNEGLIPVKKMENTDTSMNITKLLFHLITMMRLSFLKV